MLYRLSYASGGSKSFQAQYFLVPFLNVRDNYLRYHKGYRGATGTRNPKLSLARACVWRGPRLRSLFREQIGRTGALTLLSLRY